MTNVRIPTFTDGLMSIDSFQVQNAIQVHHNLAVNRGHRTSTIVLKCIDVFPNLKCLNVMKCLVTTSCCFSFVIQISFSNDTWCALVVITFADVSFASVHHESHFSNFMCRQAKSTTRRYIIHGFISWWTLAGCHRTIHIPTTSFLYPRINLHLICC